MDESVLKLPKYVFRRPNGSYRYKRNVPKVLQKYIYKKTIYRQLGASYTEGIANLPRVHRQIEHLFQIERLTHPEERAATLIEANLGEVWLDAAKMGMVGQEHNVLLSQAQRRSAIRPPCRNFYHHDDALTRIRK